MMYGKMVRIWATEEERVKKMRRSLESENTTCATLRGHLSNSWALARLLGL